MKVLVVDDEPLARARLAAMLAQHTETEVVGEAGNGRMALEMAERLAPDLVLLDIRMPGMDGLEAARHMAGLADPPVVVFVTAYDEHALAAFDASAIDYLLKPVRQQRLEAALDKARRLVGVATAGVPAPVREAPRTCISAKGSTGLTLVPLEDVRCFRADQKYVSVFHVGGELLIEESLKNLETEFGERFVRIHRNALVAVAWLRGLERCSDGRYLARVADCTTRLEVSRRHLAAVRRQIRTGA